MKNRLFLKSFYVPSITLVATILGTMSFTYPADKIDEAIKGPPRRISGQVIDLGKVQPIYMVSGMATLIEIPDAVTGIRIGNPDAVRYFQPKKPENEVTLVLEDHQAKPTNLIIRSGKRKYVFDIIPSKSVHQDTVEVVGAFGGAEIDGQSAVLIDSSESALSKNGTKKP
jgi:hypothetical protein